MCYRSSYTWLLGGPSSFLFFISLSLLTWNTFPSSGLDCTKAKRDWLTYRYKVLVTGSASVSYSQPVCLVSEGNSCCDKQMESDILAVGERELSTSFANWLTPIAEQMENDSIALDYFFRSDLIEARNRLHEDFSGIYGYNYKVNHGFFFHFFNDLEAYMAGRRGNLAQLVTNFFNQLRTSIVVLMEKADMATGSAVTPDSQRINCLSEALGKKNAFDRTDVHLREQFLQVYPTARMLVNSLAAGSKLLHTVVEDASKRPECVVAFSRFRYCGTFCGAREGVQAEVCPSGCENFIRACFVDASSDISKSLPHVWSKLISAITVTTKRLERTQNFASVNKDLHIFLSEAITYVHQKYATVKALLVQECKYSTGGGSGGNSPPAFKPPHATNDWTYSSRTRRSASNSSHSFELLRRKRQGSYQGRSWQPEPPAWAPPISPMANAQQPDLAQPHSSYQSYFSSSGRGGGGINASPSTQHSVNAPEKLTKWATQLKYYYSGVQDLFARAPTSVCSSTTQQNTVCWNPPPTSPTSQSKRHTAAVTALNAITERLGLINSQNNGDPEALELGARILAEVKMRNASTPSHGTSSLIQPMNPAGTIYGQPQLRSHDPWRTGASSDFESPQPMHPLPPSSSYDTNQYLPGASYQMQSAGAPFPSHIDTEAEGSGYNAAGNVLPPVQPGYAPPPGQSSHSLQPDFTSPGGVSPLQHPPPPSSNQYWNGPEASGFGGGGAGGSWNQGGPWQQPIPPSNYYPDQQGSGVPPNLEGYPPPPVEVISTTTAPSTPTMTILTTTSSLSNNFTTPIPTPPKSPSPLPPARPVKVENASSSLPPSSSIGFDDEDFGQPTVPFQPLPTTTQRPAESQQPDLPFDSGANEQYSGGKIPFMEPSGLPRGQPDCSLEAITRGGSMDPRCLPGGVPDQTEPYSHSGRVPPDWLSPESPHPEGPANSGLVPDGLESPHTDYTDVQQLPELPKYGELPDFGLVAPTELPLRPTDLDRPNLLTTEAPPATIPTTTPLQELPPDIWLPVPELQPGDPKFPNSKLFLPNFPPHRDRPMPQVGRVNTAGVRTAHCHVIAIVSLLIAMSLLI